MAANDEIPRGWLQTDNGGENAQVYITYPAVPGIAWVATFLQWQLLADGETITLQEGVVVEPGGYTYTIANCVLAAEGGWQETGDSWSGEIPGPIDTAMVMGFSGGATGAYENVITSCYPI